MFTPKIKDRQLGWILIGFFYFRLSSESESGMAESEFRFRITNNVRIFQNSKSELSNLATSFLIYRYVLHKCRTIGVGRQFSHKYGPPQTTTAEFLANTREI